MSRIFYNSNRKRTDILHSQEFNSMSFAERRALAFNKEELAKLNKTDKLLMRGYAQSLSEQQKAYQYNHSVDKAVKSKKARKVNVRANQKPRKLTNY